MAEPAGPTARAAKRARRAAKKTVSVAAASVEIVKKKEQESEPMRASRAAAAATAAAAAATAVTVSDIHSMYIWKLCTTTLIHQKYKLKPLISTRTYAPCHPKSFDFLPTLAPAGLFVGCSGCSYKHWHASKAQPRNFYPFPSAAREFAHYAAHFNSLEINYSFYRLPRPETCARWRAQAPRPDFLYVLKAHRYFTHTKRIHVDQWFKKKWEEAFWPRCQEVRSSFNS